MRVRANRACRGMALLLVVALLALLTLLVVSLAAITRVETRRGGLVLQQVQARHNALFALDAALAKLQRLAGSDYRATATAGPPGAGLAQPHWVGVWSSDVPATSPLGWLVSGSTPDPAAGVPAGERSILLMRGAAGEETGADAVRVPWMMLPPDEAGAAPGGYGFHIADEGVKATLAAAGPRAYGWTTDVAHQRQALMGGAFGVGFDQVTGFDPTTPEIQTRLAGVLGREQWPTLSPALDATTLRARRHDYTAWSRGLLIDPVRGRLKQDLSLEGDAAIPGLDRYRALATPERSALLSPAYPIRPASAPGPLYDGIVPLLTQLGLQFSVHTISATSRTLEARLRFYVELANPWSSALAGEDLLLVISGLPQTIEIEARTAGSTANHGSASVDLTSLYALHRGSDGRPAIEFDLPFGAARWEPGRVHTWRLPSGNTMGESANRVLEFDASSRTSYWRERPGGGLDGPDALNNTSELRFRGVEDWNLFVELRRSNGEVLSRHHLPTFYAVDSAWQDANSTLPDFGLEVRLVDRSDAQDAAGASAWLRETLTRDLRRPDFDPRDWVPTIDLETASYNLSFNPPNSAVEARQLFNRDPVDRSALSYHQPAYNSDVALFELPHQPWVSVGSLQHLAFADAPVYDVGNSWSSRNDWFDRFFFSTRQDTTDFRDLPQSPHVARIPARGGDPHVTATIAWVRDAFNLNSTSTEAWRAVLRGLGTGGLPHDFDYTVHDPATGEVEGVASAVLHRPVARFAQSAGEMWECTPNPANHQAGLRTYRRGARELSPAQVGGLARRIAANVARRAAERGPFVSVADFLAPDPSLFGGRNLLEYSIDDYDASAPPADRIQWDHTFPDDPLKIDLAAPGYLTSGDLMTALAPLLVTRSDTFIVRAYGEVGNPLDAEQPAARAWLEAVVQRFPDPVDPEEFADASGLQMKVDAKWGRRFRVVRLRWLTEDDL